MSDVRVNPEYPKRKPPVTRPLSNLHPLDPAAFTWSLKRTPVRNLSWARLLRGGRLSDGGRIGRYALIAGLGLAMAWGPAIGYVKFGPISYSSHFSLILPGAGASSSVNLAEIGQASSAASSAFSSSTISPTVTYKNLIMSANVIDVAASDLKISREELGVPTVRLVDETSFITVEVSGHTAQSARDRAKAVEDAFFSELSKLRDDEIRRRDGATVKTVKEYEESVKDVRARISLLQRQSGLNSADQFNQQVASVDTLKLKILEVEAALAKQALSVQSLAASLDISPSLAATAMKLHADPQFAALVDATSKAQAEYAQVGQQFGGKHPKVVEAKAKFVGVQNQMLARASKLSGMDGRKLAGKLDFSSTGQRAGLMAQLVTLTAEKQGLEGQLESMRTQLSSGQDTIERLVDVAAKLDGLNRDFKIAEAVFASALARISTSKADIFASYPMVQEIEAPMVPMKKSSPNKKVAIGAAAGSTLVLMVAVLLGWIRRPIIDKLLKRPAENS